MKFKLNFQYVNFRKKIFVVYIRIISFKHRSLQAVEFNAALLINIIITILNCISNFIIKIKYHLNIYYKINISYYKLFILKL